MLNSSRKSGRTPWAGDQQSLYQHRTRQKRGRQTSLTRAGFDLMILVSEIMQTFQALHQAASRFASVPSRGMNTSSHLVMHIWSRIAAVLLSPQVFCFMLCSSLMDGDGNMMRTSDWLLCDSEVPLNNRLTLREAVDRGGSEVNKCITPIQTYNSITWLWL
jgi:hypothetical protein